MMSATEVTHLTSMGTRASAVAGSTTASGRAGEGNA
jgi:hypothetical protein